MSNVINALKQILTTDFMFTNLPLLILVLTSSVAFAFVYSIIKTIIELSPKGKAGL